MAQVQNSGRILWEMLEYERVHKHGNMPVDKFRDDILGISHKAWYNYRSGKGDAHSRIVRRICSRLDWPLDQTMARLGGNPEPSPEQERRQGLEAALSFVLLLSEPASPLPSIAKPNPEWLGRLAASFALYDEALKHYEEALAQARSDRDVQREVLVQTDVALAFILLGNHGPATEALDRARTSAERIGDRWGFNRAMVNDRLLQLRQGTFAKLGDTGMTESLHASMHGLDDVYGLAKDYFTLAYAEFLQGSLDAAHDLIEKSSYFAARAANFPERVKVWMTSLTRFRADFRDFLPAGGAWRKAFAVNLLADIEYLRGQPPAPLLALYSEGSAFRPLWRLKVADIIATARFRAQVELQMPESDPYEVIESVEEERDTLHRHGATWDEVVVSNILGSLYVRVGDWGDALQSFRRGESLANGRFLYEEYESLYGQYWAIKRANQDIVTPAAQAYLDHAKRVGRRHGFTALPTFLR